MKAPLAFSGAVLAGGASARMGVDKALLGVGGRPLAAVAAAALGGAGAAEVLAVGGDPGRLGALGLRPVADRHPGEGPLGAVVTALSAAAHDPVVVLSCDLPSVAPGAVDAVLAGLAASGEADAALAEAGGRTQVLLGAYRRRCLPALEAAFAAGERSMERAVAAALRVVAVPLADPAWARDVDTPADIARVGAAGGRPASGHAGGVSDSTWVADAAALDEVVAAAAAEPAYAIDTEFHREGSYYPRVALVQVAWPGCVALIDPLAVDLAPLAAVLDGPGVAVAHAAEQDLEVLEQACGTAPGRLFDTQVAAGFLGWSTPSLATLLHDVLGVRLPKGDRVSDWTRRPLSADQRAYAAADVAHLLDVHAALSARLVERGRLAWAADECETLRTRRRGGQDPDTAWWRLKDARNLRGRSRGVAQAVAAWRERQAAAADRPPRTVLPDLALLSIAQRPPPDEAALRQVRGLDGRHLRGAAAAGILAAVREGESLAPGRLRPPPADDMERALRPAATLVSAWIAQLARDQDVDTALLATRADLHALLRGDPGARLLAGWRADLVGEPVRRLVEGEAALAFDGAGRLVLEPREAGR